ncbi:MAG: hypothetical protein N3D12_03635 [Candidatus Methanomethyliaceae archaeon]|nr:hypothetical protein [Candidatus Methanomethyliaceae archaeon]
MARVYSKSFQVSFVSLMIALTLIFELLNRALPLRVPWGMSIDFVALPIMITFFILGMGGSIVAAFGMFLMLCIAGYGNIIGAVMKTATTVSMVVTLGILSNGILRGPPQSTYKSIPKYSISAVASLLVRCGVAVVLNYYWALPLFFQMPVEKIIESFFFGSYFGFVSFVSTMNIVQGLVDLVGSWLIVFGVARRFLEVKRL